MSNTATATAAPAETKKETPAERRARLHPFPTRSPMYYCMHCPACTTLRRLMAEPKWQLLDQYDQELAAEHATEDTDCECGHTTAECELFDPEMHDDEDCGQCHPEQDEDARYCR